MIKIEQVDITTLAVDAIVNAAKTSLLGGGGVDGAIHAHAGPKLRAFCSVQGGCKTGDAKITPGYELPAHYVIHTVGPVWTDGDDSDRVYTQEMDKLLASCYRRSMELANALGLKSIAFPAISTGIFGYPIERAARIAQSTVMGYLAMGLSSIQEVTFCCFSDEDLSIYENVQSSLRLRIAGIVARSVVAE